MIEAYAPADVRAAEESCGDLLADGTLMRRAAKGVARAARTRLEQLGATRVVALVGPGHNGADALWVIERLARRGYEAAAVCQDPEAHPAQTEAAAAARRRGGQVLTAANDNALEVIGRAELVIDGITGLGGRAGLPPFAQPWVEAVPAGAHVLALDLPSGQSPDGGPLADGAVVADETVAIGACKPVHLLPPGAAACGRTEVLDIGLDLGGTEPAAALITDTDVAEQWPVPSAHDNKYSRGVLGVIAGGEDYTGAAVLSVTAAVEAGAGMVRYVGTPTPTLLVRQAVPEAVHGPGQVQAWVIGPGLQTRSRAKGALAQLTAARQAIASDVAVLLDAGGLDLLDGPREGPTLLTPHAGEAARLLTRLGREVTRAEVSADPLAHARELAEQTGACVLLKGARTVVIDPEGGPVLVAAAAPPWLATAGAGDVLAGVIGVLLAAGLPPALAGALGAHVHGRAAAKLNPGGPIRSLRVAHGIAAGLTAR